MMLKFVFHRILLGSTALMGVVLIAGDAVAQSTGGAGGNGAVPPAPVNNLGGAGQGFGTAGSTGVSGGGFTAGGGGGGGAAAAGGAGGTGSAGGAAGVNGTTGTPQGGQGSAAANAPFSAGGGGGGGNGIRISTGGTYTQVNAAGGNGGAGGSITNTGSGGGGGSGGYGIGATGTPATINASGIILGGNGGNGGAGVGSSNSGGASGNGGDGGGGIYLGSAGSTLNLTAGTVTGGNGGAAGGGAGRTPGVAGRGGNGVDAVGGSDVVNVSAGVAILGGNGGAGAIGGAGLLGNGVAVTNLGTISGGLSDLSVPGAVQANALTFTGGNNSLALGNGTTTGTINGAIGVNGGTLAIDPGTVAGASVTLGNLITGAGGVTKSGAGTLSLTAANTYTGGTTFAAGTLNLGSANALGTAGVLLFTGGALQYSAANQTDYSGRFSAAANQQYRVDTNGQNVTFASALTSSGGSLAKSGLGTLSLTGANTYSGGATVAGGVLNLGSAGALGTSGVLSLTGGTLQYSAANQTDYSNRFSTAANQRYNIDTNGQDVTWASALASSGGSLAKTGTGTLTLSGANTYTGATTISAGTLVNNGSLTSSVSNAATFINNGTVTGGLTNTAGTTTVAGSIGSRVAISGGSVFLTGTGSVDSVRFMITGGAGNGVFDISNTIAGASVSAVFSTVAAPGTVELGSKTLTFITNSDTSVFYGIVQGSGGITIAPGGYFSPAISSVGAYTGATTAAGGGLFIRAQNGIAASSVLDITSVGGQVRIETPAANIRSLRGIAGSVVSLQSALTLTNAWTAFAGTINDFGSGGSVTLAAGHQTLDGNNAYVGATNVNGGTLTVNGSIASSSLTTVNAGGTLGGTGTVGNTTVNGGTLAPGNSIGTLNVAGNLVFNAASSYLVEVSPSSADRVNVSGTAALGGATVTASFATAPGAYISKQYTIVNAAGGRTGTFGALVNANLPTNITSALSYDANNAYLNLTLAYVPPPPTPPSPTPTPTPTPTPAGPTSPIYVPLSANQQAVGATLVNYFNRNGGIPAVFATLTPTGLTQVSGETATGSQQTTFDAMNQFMGILSDPWIDGRGSNDTASAIPFADETMAYAAKRRPGDALAAIYRKAPLMAPAFVPSWSVWAAGFGGSQTTDGNAAAGSSTSSSRLYGTAVGADYRFSPGTIAGFALAGGGSNFSVANAGSGRSDLFQAGAFFRHTTGPAYLSAALAYGWQDVTTDRAVGFDRLQARFSANAFSGRIEGGYRLASAWMAVTPYVAAQITAFDLPGYGETPAAGTGTFALNYAGKTVTASRTELGIRTDRSFAVNDALLTLRGRAAWAHDYNFDRSVAATFQALPGASFVVNGAAPARDAALTTASAEMKWRNGISLAATFEGEFSDVTRSYAGKGVVRYAW